MSEQTLLAQLANKDALIRKDAAKQIAASPDVIGELRIVQVFGRETDAGVLKWLALALARIGGEQYAHNLFRKADSMQEGEPREWVRLAAHILDRKQNNELVASLIESHDRSALSEAAQLIWAAGGYDGTYAEKLFKLAEHEDPSVRRWSILALGQGGGLTSTDRVRHSLSDPNYLVREWTECAIASLKDPQAAGSLLPGLEDPHPRVREWAIKALASTAHKDLPMIFAELVKRESDPQCREAVFRALATMPDPPYLLDIVYNEIRTCVDPIVFLAVIDLVVAKEHLRKNVDLVRTVDQQATKCDAILLGPYLGQQLRTAFDPEQRRAIALIEADPSLMIALRPFNQNPMPSGDTVNNASHQVSVGVVIALREEFTEFQQVVASISPVGPKHPNHYFFKSTGGTGGVAVLVGKKGIAAAMAASAEIFQLWHPALIANIGIAGSIDKDLLLGDVLIASQVNDYLQDSKAISTTSGWEFHLSGDPYKLNPRLLKASQNFEFTQPTAVDLWKQDALGDLGQLLSLPQLEQLIESKQIRRTPIFIDGRLASGPTVVAATEFSAWLKQKDRAFKAVEMESAGVMAFADDHDSLLAITVRGASDFADDRKSALEESTGGAIRKIAMRNASRWLLAALPTLLAQTPQP